MTYIVASSKVWRSEMLDNLKKSTSNEFILMDKKELLTLEYLQQISPKMIFFPHWSFIIPEEIFSNYQCVVFHMTDLPFGRGGSPLQNLLAQGIYHTKISALLCEKEIDSGPIYLKKDLSLEGTGQEIYCRANEIIEKMIIEIIDKKLSPEPQQGEAVYFKRRTPQDGNLQKLISLEQAYDFIRMLDAEGYPRSFLETEYLRFEFEHAIFHPSEITAKVKITRKES